MFFKTTPDQISREVLEPRKGLKNTPTSEIKNGIAVLKKVPCRKYERMVHGNTQKDIDITETVESSLSLNRQDLIPCAWQGQTKIYTVP